MQIGRPTLDSADIAAAPASSARTPHPVRSSRSTCLAGGLPISGRGLLLYAIGPDSDVRDYLPHARAMTRVLQEGIAIALVCQNDYPHALEEFGLDHWDQIVYLVNRRPVLAWPIGTGLPRCSSPSDSVGQA